MRAHAIETPRPGSPKELRVSDIAGWPALHVEPESRADEAFELMREAGVRHLLVTAGHAPLGIVCQLDAVEASRAPVSEILHPPVFVDPWDTAAWAVGLLWGANACAVVVRVPGRPCGILTRGDVTRAGVCGPWPCCESCGSHHRVRWNYEAEVAFCSECLESVQPHELDELYVDLGVVD